MQNTTLKPKVFVALSGGVDSSVAAALLKYGGFSARGGSASGWDVRGVHIKMWSDPEIPCTLKEDRYDAIRVAAKLGIPFETWDFTEEYRKAVVEYMIREYAAGRTPNPDVMCNRHIKFGIFLKKALDRGADFVATGHYVRKGDRVEPIANRGSGRTLYPIGYTLLAGRDVNKDQSYFLWTLNQGQLGHCIFPIGDYTKPEVRALAKKFGLPTADKEESQGICFIGEINVREFLKKHIPERRGFVQTTSGKIIGEHEGFSFYTIGQREGLGIGGGIPYYVAAKDFSTNTLVVTEGPYDDKLFAKELVATDVNWISGREPKLPLRCEARIRYRQPLQSCIITRNNANINAKRRESFGVDSRLDSRTVRVRFSEAQRAVTPGQSVVFYQDGEMLGGGIIAFS